MVLAAGLVALGASRWGRLRVVAAVKGAMVAPPAGEGRWVAWVEGDRGETRLMVLPRYRGRPAVALTAAALSGLAVEGDAAYLTRSAAREGGRVRAELVRVRLPRGTPTVIAALNRRASQIAYGDGWLCWREDYEAGLPGVPFVAAAAPLTVVRARQESGGSVRVVAVVSGAEVGPASGDLELLGVMGESAYWVERAPVAGVAATVVHRARLPGGKAETVVREEGWRTVALGKDMLVWTAPSLEADRPDGVSAVKQDRLDGSGVKVIADWLGPSAAVMVTGAGIFAQDRYLLWKLGSERGQQRVIAQGPGWFSLSRIAGDEQYLIVESKAGTQVARRPVTWWARVRSLLP